MKEIKLSNQHYLEAPFETADKKTLWNMLVKYVRENASAFSTIRYSEKTDSIYVFYKSESEFLDIIRRFDIRKSLIKSIIRTTNLNLTFDRTTKHLKLSSENVEDFPNYNEVTYSLACNDDFRRRDSIFFHESSLVDYTNGFDAAAFEACPYRVCVISYDVNRDIAYSSGDIERETFTECVFLCYNVETSKLENDTYEDKLNISKALNASKFISRLQC